jgi:hypothetical protein
MRLVTEKRKAVAKRAVGIFTWRLIGIVVVVAALLVAAALFFGTLAGTAYASNWVAELVLNSAIGSSPPPLHFGLTVIIYLCILGILALAGHSIIEASSEVEVE